jgi:hypothetical protein
MAQEVRPSYLRNLKIWYASNALISIPKMVLEPDKIRSGMHTTSSDQATFYVPPQSGRSSPSRTQEADPTSECT